MKQLVLALAISVLFLSASPAQAATRLTCKGATNLVVELANPNSTVSVYKDGAKVDQWKGHTHFKLKETAPQYNWFFHSLDSEESPSKELEVKLSGIGAGPKSGSGSYTPSRGATPLRLSCVSQ